MNPHIEWETLEFVEKPKKPDWYWAVGIISVTAAITAFVFNNIIFGIFLLLSGFAICLHASLKPKKMHYAVSEKGVIIGDRMYLWKDLESFWVEDNRHEEKTSPEHKSQILLKSKKSLIDIITIPIHEEIQLDELKTYLSKYLSEKEQKIPLSHAIMERIGF